jgi:hypothetical protein
VPWWIFGKPSRSRQIPRSKLRATRFEVLEKLLLNACVYEEILELYSVQGLLAMEVKNTLSKRGIISEGSSPASENWADQEMHEENLSTQDIARRAQVAGSLFFQQNFVFIDERGKMSFSLIGKRANAKFDLSSILPRIFGLRQGNYWL